MLKRQNNKKLYRGRRQPSIYSRTEADVVKREYKKSLLIVGLLIATLALVYFLFLSPTFRINNIEATTLEYSDNDAIREVIESHKNKLINHNIFLFREKPLENELLGLEGIESAIITKKYPHTITVQIKEKNPSLVWETGGSKYLLDDKGVIWGDYDDRFQDIPRVIDTKNVPIKVGQKVVPARFTVFIADLDRDFEAYASSKISRMEISDATQEVKVVSDAGWYGYFNTEATVKNQLINLSRIVNETIKANKKLEYIDLRIENRIFYK